MDALQQESLADRGLIVSDSSGRDAVRVYLQHLSETPSESPEDRGKNLREFFEHVAHKRAHTGVELLPETFSVTGQMIEALLPLEFYEQATRELEDDDVRVDLVESFDATL
jgi:hypothetical protein